MPEMKMQLLLLTTLIAFAGCMPSGSKLSIDFRKKENHQSTSTAHISSVQIINHQLIINGTGLGNITHVNVDGNSINETFTIDSKSATQIFANSIRNFSFDTSKVFNLIISDANASATFQIDFSLCNATMGAAQFDCATTPSNNDVLVFDQGVWTPKSIGSLGSLVYKGVWDATTSLPAATSVGQYYIITEEDLPTYPLNDWIVWNGTAYDVIHQSAVSGVSSFKGRTGAVVPLANDYDLSKMADVDFSVAPTPGHVLKIIGGKWIAVDDDVGFVVGAGSITATELANNSVTDAKIVGMATSKLTGTISSAQITDGTIVNADINGAAAIDYSKINVPDGIIDYVKLNVANGEIPAAKISGLPVLSTILAASITNGDTTHAPDGNAVFDALATKLDKTGGTILTILNVPTPVLDTEATTKLYVDTADNLKANKAGDTFSGVLTLNNDLLIKGGSNYVTVKGNAASAAYTLTLPVNAGTANQVLTTNGSGVLSWSAPSSIVNGLNAANISGGAVSNAEFDYLDGVTSSIQTQLNAKEASLPTGGTALQYFAGNKTLQTLNTAAVPESGSNYYFTDVRTRAATLTGLSAGAGTLLPGDTVLGAFGKLLTTQGDYVSKSTNSTVLGQVTIDPTTGVLNVPNPGSLTQATNRGWVESLVDSYGHWTKTVSDISFTTGNVGIGGAASATATTELKVTGDAEVTGTLQANNGITSLGMFVNGWSGSWAPVQIKNGANDGYAGIIFTDSSNVSQAAFGYSNTGAGIMPGAAFFTSMLATTPVAIGIGGVEAVRVAGTTGYMGIGVNNPQARLDVGGAIISRTAAAHAAASVDLSTSNTHVLSVVGQSAITLTNMVHGGSYTIIIQEAASRTYTFTGCNTSKFQPANMPTIASTHTMYNIVTVGAPGSFDCYISWSSGYN